MRPLLPSQDLTALNVQTESMGEKFIITPGHDETVLQSWLLTMPEFASITQGDYIAFSDGAGNIELAIVMDKDANGSVPGGGTIYAGMNAVSQCDIVSGDSTSVIATKFVAAVTAADGGYSAEVGSGAQVRVWADYISDSYSATPKNITDAGAGSLSASVEYSQVTSNAFYTKYITLNSTATAYYLWFSVNDTANNGDPAPIGKTAIRADITKRYGPTSGPMGITKNEWSEAMATALNAVGSGAVFKASVKEDSQSQPYVEVTNLVVGSCTDPTVGNATGLVAVAKLRDGHSSIYAAADSVETLSTTNISAITGV